MFVQNFTKLSAAVQEYRVDKETAKRRNEKNLAMMLITIP